MQSHRKKRWEAPPNAISLLIPLDEAGSRPVATCLTSGPCVSSHHLQQGGKKNQGGIRGETLARRLRCRLQPTWNSLGVSHSSEQCSACHVQAVCCATCDLKTGAALAQLVLLFHPCFDCPETERAGKVTALCL